MYPIPETHVIRKPIRGDYLLFYDTGAYSDFFSSNANSFPRTAKAVVSKDGTHRLMVRREKMSDIFNREVEWNMDMPSYNVAVTSRHIAF